VPVRPRQQARSGNDSRSAFACTIAARLTNEDNIVRSQARLLRRNWSTYFGIVITTDSRLALVGEVVSSFAQQPGLRADDIVFIWV